MLKLSPFNAADYLHTDEQWAVFAKAFLGEPMHEPLPADENWMRVGPNTDAAIWRPWGRETGEL